MTNRSQVLHKKAARLQLAIAEICVNHGAPSWIVCISMGSDRYLVIKADFTVFGAFIFPHISNLDLIKIRVEVSNPPSFCFATMVSKLS